MTLNASQRAVSKHLAAVVAVSHFLEAVLCAICRGIQAQCTIAPDAVAYSTLNLLIWLIISLIHTDAEQVYRLSNLSIWGITLCLDGAVCFLSFRPSNAGFLECVELSIRFIRIASLAFLCVSTTWSTKTPRQRQSEQEPPLQSENTNSVFYSTRKDTILEHAKGGESGDDSSNTSWEQNERIDQVGGWWAYMHEVKFLLPYIVPIEDRRRQLYALVMFVLMLCDRASVLLGPRLLGNIVQTISNKESTETGLYSQILIYIFAIKVSHDLVLEPARRWLSIRYFYDSYLDLLLSLASHVFGLSFEFHENKQTGEIIAAIGQGEILNKFVDDFIENTLPLVLDIIVAFGYLTYLFDVYVGLILATTYVFYGVVTYKGTMLCARVRRKYRETSRIEWNVLHEAVANWMSTFYLNRQEYQHRRLERLTRQELMEQAHGYDLSLTMRVCQTLVMCLGYCAILLRTVQLVSHAKDAVGDFVTLLFYWSFFTTPLFKIAHFYSSITELLVDVERLRQLMHTKPSVNDREGARDFQYRDGKVEFRNVSFTYDGERLVLDHLNFVVEPGCTVAFVGRSGSGKTTTCDKLLFRAYDVTEGAILIDDQDIRSLKQRSLRETIGIVRQEPTFNNDTVLENVRYARLEASDEEVVTACKDAAIHDQITRFPMGYHTRIGERGIKLSGGERQRLAIAQLFLRNPKIVVMDEATSSVDNVTEAEIQESFARICKGRTTIIIAHRLSTVQHVDKIFVLDRGNIAERGNHEELLRLRGRYSQLWNKTQTAKKLKSDLERVNCSSTEGLRHGHRLIDLSSDSGSEADCGSLGDIMQVDGASSSKQTDEGRTGMRKRLNSLKEKFRGSKNRDEEDESYDEEDEDTSPIRVISPRVTEASPPVTFSRRSSRRRFSRGMKSSLVSSPISPTGVQTRDISAPTSPVHMSTQEPLDHNPVSPPSRIPISVHPLATPVRTRQSSTRDALLQSPLQSPGRNAALHSHPILTDGDDINGSEETYHTAGSSTENRTGIN
ncbi:hypothetical protein N0V90_001034 [Kalmusia sp. IMI 367209]|nr:hypothetical protein N0V90_001034 [Kalmusia sp. IMI 367209]